MKELNEMQEEARMESFPQGFPQTSMGLNSSTDRTSSTLRQPETRPITKEQLIYEVKGIYVGLIMVEWKCIQIERQLCIQQLASNTNKISNEHWQVLIALHRALLHEHHDFYLACHHPSASTALRGLARKYAMPARMWEHGLNGFLKILRSQMPGTSEHMLAYLDHAYSVLEDLQEHVPSLSTEWSQCVKGLNVYRDELQRFRDQEQQSEVTETSSFGQTSGIALELVRTGRTMHVGAMIVQLWRYGMGWHCCSPRLSGWDNEQGTVSFCPHYPGHDYQSMSESYSNEIGAISFPDTPYEEIDWCDNFQPAYETKAGSATGGSSSSSSSSSHTTADTQEFHEQNPHGPPNNNGGLPQPWGTEMSHIAILVLIGWLFAGQGCDLDFNIFVKVFCILALPDLR
jgi:hypothetical protein